RVVRSGRADRHQRGGLRTVGRHGGLADLVGQRHCSGRGAGRNGDDTVGGHAVARHGAQQRRGHRGRARHDGGAIEGVVEQ
ncbi:hypothetical protein B8W90_12985, partial [Staphylococcus hominis]